MEACDKGNTDIAKILVDAGASLTMKNKVMFVTQTNHEGNLN